MSAVGLNAADEMLHDSLRHFTAQSSVVMEQHAQRLGFQQLQHHNNTSLLVLPAAIHTSLHTHQLPALLPVMLSHDTRSSGNRKYLHWLPIEQRIRFKLAMLTHNTLCSTQPACLHSLLNHHTPTRYLRSANTKLLSAPRVRIAFTSRGFSVAALSVWNSLPSGIRDVSSTHTFRRLLKTHCFQQAFGSP